MIDNSAGDDSEPKRMTDNAISDDDTVEALKHLAEMDIDLNDIAGQTIQHRESGNGSADDVEQDDRPLDAA